MPSEKLNKPYISPSQINTYLRCGEQYRRRYVMKHVIPPGIAQLKGTSVHKGAEHNFKQKKDSHEDLKTETVVEVAVNTFKDTVKHEGLFLNEEEETQGKAKVMGKAIDETVKLSELLMAEVSPKYQPIEIEETQLIELPNSTHDLKGIIDLKIDKGNIVDIKTSGKSWTQEKADKDIQFTFYAMMDHSKTGQGTKPLIVENLVNTKIPKVLTFETERSMKDYDPLIKRINAVVDGINKGVYPPAPSDSWACSRRFCGYFDSCSYINNTRRPNDNSDI